jgi:hypothetical protein
MMATNCIYPSHTLDFEGLRLGLEKQEVKEENVI